MIERPRLASVLSPAFLINRYKKFIQQPQEKSRDWIKINLASKTRRGVNSEYLTIRLRDHGLFCADEYFDNFVAWTAHTNPEWKEPSCIYKDFQNWRVAVEKTSIEISNRRNLSIFDSRCNYLPSTQLNQKREDRAAFEYYHVLN